MDDEIRRGIWLALRRAGLGSKNFALLLKHFGEIGAAWDAPADELRRAGLDAPYLRATIRARASFDPGEEMELLAKAGARLITWADAGYPPLLRDIPQSPPVLVVRGHGDAALTGAIAVVGTRRATPYGRRATREFCEEFCRVGLAIVSGLARGIDAVAHRVAVEAGAVTVGVLAGGLDEIYPREHESLAARIEEAGCILSEYPIGVPARPDYFPRRNRILAGLATATLVVEAGKGSGALHTANWAFEQGRDVFAVPGNIYSRSSEGCHRLIRDNVAALVTEPAQLMGELRTASFGRAVPLPEQGPAADNETMADLSPDAKRIMEGLGARTLHVDELARDFGSPVERLTAELAVLELQGRVTQVGPMIYSASSEPRA
ncbi:MAG: DNA-processing protein DprA [Dehalococcoidia bacterium]